MPITEAQLLQILPRARNVSELFIPALNGAMARYQINTIARIAAFLAQAGHESSELTRLVENLNYSAAGLMGTWPKRFPAALAAKVERKPEQIAEIAYGGRMGNTAPGDGWRYRGRGLIQVTGLNNYRECGRALQLDLLNNPELLEQPEHAAMSAAWYWSENGLNALADVGQFDNITRKINGGLNGQADRLNLFGRGLKALA